MWKFFLAFATTTAWAQTPEVPTKGFSAALQDILQAPEYQAVQSEIRSVELDFASRDIVLEPTVEVRRTRVNDNRENLFSTANSRPRFDTLTTLLSKPFSTGTEISVGPSWERTLAPSLDPDRQNTVDWQIGLNQSLWQDGFGRSTRLRRAREDAERKRELAAAYLRRAQLLNDFETVYWDWALAIRQAELQAKNVRRGREILRWVQDRFNRAAAESTDLLQARALLTQRELQLATLNLNLIQAETRLERFFPNRGWRPSPADLSVMRDPDNLPARWEFEQLDRISMLEYLAVKNEAVAAEARARETRESIRPELDLEFLYRKNAVDPDFDRAMQDSYRQDHDYSSISLVFRTGLDLGRERKKVDSARAARDGAVQRRQARESENRIAWDQLKRELVELRERLKTSTELVDLQNRKANAERERYRKGRSTAFQAITFEQEAAEAEITLWTLYALMRKTEARARLFAR